MEASRTLLIKMAQYHKSKVSNKQVLSEVSGFCSTKPPYIATVY